MNVEAVPWYPCEANIIAAPPPPPGPTTTTTTAANTAAAAASTDRKVTRVGIRHDPYGLRLLEPSSSPSLHLYTPDGDRASGVKGTPPPPHPPHTNAYGGARDEAEDYGFHVRGTSPEEASSWPPVASVSSPTDSRGWPIATAAAPSSSSSWSSPARSRGGGYRGGSADSSRLLCSTESYTSPTLLQEKQKQKQQQQQQQQREGRAHSASGGAPSRVSSSPPVAMIPIPKSKQLQLQQQQQQQQQLLSSSSSPVAQPAAVEPAAAGHTRQYTHQPYPTITTTTTTTTAESSAPRTVVAAATTTTATTTATARATIAWPSSAALRAVSAQQQQQPRSTSTPNGTTTATTATMTSGSRPGSGCCSAAAPADAPSPSPSPATVAEERAASAVAAAAAPSSNAPTTTAAVSYVAALIGGSRSSVFQPAVPARLLPLPRSRRPVAAKGAEAADDAAQAGVPSPSHPSGGALTPSARGSSGSPTAVASIGGDIDPRLSFENHSSSASSAAGAGSGGGAGSEEAARRPPQSSAGDDCIEAEGPTEEQQQQQQQSKKQHRRKKPANDGWVIVQGKGAHASRNETAAKPKHKPKASTAAASSSLRAKSPPALQLFHPTAFEMPKMRTARRRHVSDEEEEVVSFSDSSSSASEAIAAGRKAAGKSKKAGEKPTRGNAKSRRAQEKEEEAALLAQLEAAATAAAVGDSTHPSAIHNNASIATATSKAATTPALPSGGKAPVPATDRFHLAGIPVVAIRALDDLLPYGRATSSSSSSNNSKVPPPPRSLLSLLQRSLALNESPSAKAMLLQRAVGAVTDAVARQFPAVACAVLLEAGDCFMELERSLQCCHRALHLAEAHALPLLEMLARLATTRTLARVIDTTDAQPQLVRAAELAQQLGEEPALGWVALQLGITLELSGRFPESLRWYTAAGALARRTDQPRLLCDVLCCQAIAFYAVGETARAEAAHAASREVLSGLPRSWHSRPLQNFVQLKLQVGDMAGALRTHEEELAIAKEHGDSATAARCLGSIALVKRYLGQHEEAAALYMEELAAQGTPDARQAVESLTSAAACYLSAGQRQRALDYCVRAVRHASGTYEHCTIAKALLELAEAELQGGQHERARAHVVDALDAMSRVDGAERAQYLVKATLCELEWRCCSTLQRLAVTSEPPRMLEALLLSDQCNVPNTANVHALLRRRERSYGAAATLAAPDSSAAAAAGDAGAAAVLPSSYLSRTLVSEAALVRVLSSPQMQRRKLVCYSLPWTEESVCMAFVVSLDHPAAADGEGEGGRQLRVVGVPLELTDEVVCLLTNRSALNDTFDGPMTTVDAEPRQLYGDTPLWPQHYSKTAFDFETAQEQKEQKEQQETGAAASRLRTDVLYCLHLLHKTFIGPIEQHLRTMGDDGDDTAAATRPAEEEEGEEQVDKKRSAVTNSGEAHHDAARVRGLTFIGDGVFSRVPFHALHDGAAFLAERYSVTSCCSLALLCTLHAAQEARLHRRRSNNRNNRNNHRSDDEGGEGGDQRQEQGQDPEKERCCRGSLHVVNVQATAALHRSIVAANEKSAHVFRTTIDAAPSTSSSSSSPPSSPSSSPPPSEDVSVLLEKLSRASRDKAASNALYTAVHGALTATAANSHSNSNGGDCERGDGPSDGPQVLELDLPVLPEIREDFCGLVTSSSSDVCVCHSFEVAHTWSLHLYDLVLCSGCGTYSGMSIHETGVPVYRSLQYAGATRLLLPVGSRLPTNRRIAAVAVEAALELSSSSSDDASIADRLQAEYRRCIAEGVPLEDWASYTLCGLP